MDRTQEIVASVDYGTTNTSVAWRHPASEDVRFVDSWPGAQTPSTRVPSRIAYSRTQGNGNLNNPAWGYEITKEHVVASWIKLFLEPVVKEEIIADDNEQWKDAMGILLRPGGRDPTSIIQDFLTLLRCHVEAHIERMCGVHRLERLPITYILTVPATWSEEATTSMKEAARAAGLRGIDGNDPLVLSEPEAALTTMLCDPDIPIQAGDGVVVCDCGGGTLDIGTYFIHEKKIGAYRTLSNHTDSSGGSTMIDRAFITITSSQVAPSRFHPVDHLMSSFEDAKHAFQGTVGPAIRITYRTRKNIRILEVTRSDMYQLQYPLIVRICTILTAQINRAHQLFGRPIIKHVYISGGAASSVYLHNAIRGIFANSDIKVHRHTMPMIAVAEGAARWAHNRLLPVEQLHRHYGVESSVTPDGAMDLNNQGPQGPQGSQGPPVTWLYNFGSRYSIGESRSAKFSCRVFQDFPFAVINIYDSGQEGVPPARANPGNGVRNIGRVFCNFVEVVTSGGIADGGTIDVTLHLTLHRSKIHVKATCLNLFFGEVEIERFH
ncbi:hypothetical protein ASPBRDRAFT_208576 [Aspergillus brasiliensis CBS 101740]|uniref:Uncharacterized protein n=1 Tax=Aspergillus brasiliensis (strain CBS 101740 / IMI 381727 / IBT 21946) TaxID=767769 RepID=A0A1L9UDW9_ASPBC|nr:hypothetical protein ASPBRDRAFT_208576 [Aspergillus brasiliensis CBS 101740]